MTLSLLPLLATVQAESLPQPNMQFTPDEYNLMVRDYNFPSGLRIMFQEDHSQPIIAITMVVDRGSSHDPVGKEGIAHLVEHLWFRSRHGELPKVWDVLKELGANLNASTASDYTDYLTSAPREALIPLLRLEALRLEEAVNGVTEEVVSTEREIVRNELRMRYENGGAGALGYVLEKLYPPGHPYHRLGIGTHDSLNNIRLADIQEFVRKNYTAENATIVVVGDFKLDETWGFIQQAFPKNLLVDPKNPDGDLVLKDPPVRVPAAQDEPPPPYDQKLEVFKASTEKPTLVIAWSLPGGYRPNSALMEMMGQNLTIAIGRFLNPDFDIQRDDISALSSYGCFVMQEEVNSAAICFVEMAEGDDYQDTLETALDGLYTQWEVNSRPYQEYAFALNRRYLMAATLQSVEEVASIFAGRATVTSHFVHFTGDPAYFSRTFEWLSGVQSYDAATFAQKYLNRERAVAVVVEPYDDGDLLTDSTDAIYKGAVREVETLGMTDFSKIDEPMLTSIMSLPDLKKVEEYKLPNGLNVVMMPYGSAPIVQVSLQAKGGSWTEPKPGITEYMTDTLSSDFYENPLQYAGFWNASVGGNNSQSLGASGSSGNLDGLLWMVRSRVDSMHTVIEGQKDYIEGARKGVRYNRRYPDWWASSVASSRLFPGHKAGFVADELYYNGFAEFTTKEMNAWFDELFQPANTTLYVVGRIDDVAKAKEDIATYWGGWTVAASGKEQQAPPGPGDLPKRQVIIFDQDKPVSQTDAMMYCQVGPATMENFEARQMLAATIDEMAWRDLREQSGVTYGAGSGTRGYWGGAASLVVTSLVQNDAAGLAVKTFFKLSDRAAAGDLDPNILALMKLKEARGYVLDHQTSYAMLGRLGSAWLTGFGWEYISGHAARLAKVTVPDMVKQTERCHNHEIVTLIGPKGVIEPQLQEAGIQYEVFDWKAEGERLFAQNDPKAYAKKKKQEAKDAKKAAKKAAKEGTTTEGGTPAPEAPATPPSFVDEVLAWFGW